MAKLNPSRICARCHLPVKQHSDFLHARLRGAAVLFHWACFIRQMRESGIARGEPAEAVR
jgi:hypothetical protein